MILITRLVRKLIVANIDYRKWGVSMASIREVAKLAGVNDEVIKRAKEILKKIENNDKALDISL